MDKLFFDKKEVPTMAVFCVQKSQECRYCFLRDKCPLDERAVMILDAQMVIFSSVIIPFQSLVSEGYVLSKCIEGEITACRVCAYRDCCSMCKL